MNTPFPITLPEGSGASVISRATLVSIVGEAVVKSGEERGRLETRGPWSLPVRYTAHAVTATWKGEGCARRVGAYTFHGKRTAYAPKESGYVLECRVSLYGKKRSGFTSSVMFEVADPAPGEPRFVEIACIHVRC